MKPTDFEQSNMILGAGNNPGTDDLHVCAAENLALTEGKEIPFAVSCWEPTAEELAEINRTGKVWLSVMGWPSPPVSILGFSPFEHYGYQPLKLK